MLNNKKYHILTRYSYIIAALSAVVSCHQNPPPSHKPDNSTKEASPNDIKRKIEFVSPLPDHIYKIGQKISLEVNAVDTFAIPDSIQFLANGAWIGTIKNMNEPLIWDTKDANAGTTYISARAFNDSAIDAQENIIIKLYPAQPAVIYTYSILNTYPHSTSSYTQGLVFNQGKMFEGSGLYEKSTLQEVETRTGKIVKEYTLPRGIFGEGITVFDDKIVQISWKEQTAFIYNKNTFQLLNKINYPIKEGWGITYDGTNLIMSDGSSILYFLNKEDLTELKRIEVCDEKGPVIRLNELEYINGEIWANVYTTDTIVRIQPHTGIVTGKIDMAGLLKSSDQKPDTNVLNGIAFDAQTGSIWVTGKNWPKLFQVAIRPKKQ